MLTVSIHPEYTENILHIARLSAMFKQASMLVQCLLC